MGLIFSMAAMQCLTKEILENDLGIKVATKADPTGICFQHGVLDQIQEVAEAFIVSEFNQAVHNQLHAGRLTLQVEDMALVRRMRKLNHGFYICDRERKIKSEYLDYDLLDVRYKPRLFRRRR
jgi:histone H3/H4